MKSYKLFIILWLFPALCFGQSIAVGNWQIHLPYNDVREVVEAPNRIYCATGSSVFYLDKSDNSLNRMSKVSGLSDVSVSTIAYQTSGDILVIAYTNANIDIVKAGVTYNVSDIKRKSILGDKQIYSISFSGAFAYMSCGFGIVVLDVEKNEIKDTYYVSVGQDAVHQVVVQDDTIFAATDIGLFTAPFTGANLTDFNSWTLVTNLPASTYNSIAALNGKLFIVQPNGPDTVANDSIYVRNSAGIWSNFDPSLEEDIFAVVASYDRVLVPVAGQVYKYDDAGARLGTYSNPVDPRDAILDSDGNLWIADAYAGLNQNDASWGINPKGPGANNVFDMAFGQEDLWVAPGGRTGGWNNANLTNGLFSYVNNTWVNIDYSALNYIQDVIQIIVDPNDKQHVYAGSWGHGVAELRNGVLVTLYNETTTDTVLQSSVPGANYTRIGGLALDADNNLWVACSGVDNILCVKNAQGSWFSFQFQGFGASTRVGEVIVDAQGYKWVLIPGNGILVYDHNGTVSNSSDDQEVMLVGAAGSGNVSKDVRSIAEDLDGEIWVGTNEGIYVFYSPSLVFTNEDYDAQQILVEQDGYFQYLLETEAVTVIAIDGANRKWLGTENAGAFLMSEDGTTELQHFTTDNSPLISNSIISIAINPKNGEVFFGTEKGIISYKSTATEGAITHTTVYAYPNPVKEGYTGSIAIKGLVTDADVKITDITGALIYETKALGGQAIWNGKNFNGDKARTGIYLVLATNDLGTETVVTKIMLIN